MNHQQQHDWCEQRTARAGSPRDNPKLRAIIAPVLDQLRERYENGDRMAAVDALRLSLTHDFYWPDWLCDAWSGAIEDFQMRRKRHLCEALGIDRSRFHVGSPRADGPLREHIYFYIEYSISTGLTCEQARHEAEEHFTRLLQQSISQSSIREIYYEEKRYWESETLTRD